MAWWTAPSGATAVAAYDAIGAASLADSYVNEVTPGTYNAVPGVAPTWTAGAGQVYTGAQWLDTGIVHANNWSMIARVSGITPYTLSSGNCIAGAEMAASSTRLALFAHHSGVGSNNVVYGMGGYVAVVPNLTSGVLAVGGHQGYRNGAADGGVIGAWSGTNTATVLIGAEHFGVAGVQGFLKGTIAALAIYSGTLTAADVAAITTAMNALPTAATSAMLHMMLEHARLGFL